MAISLCGSEVIHPKLRTIIKMKLKKARALLTKAANANATKAAKLLTKAQAQITVVGSKEAAGCRVSSRVARPRVRSSWGRRWSP